MSVWPVRPAESRKIIGVLYRLTDDVARIYPAYWPFVLIAISGLLASSSAFSQSTGSLSADELAKRASSSVVRIDVYGDDGEVSQSGAGLVLSTDGTILANYATIQNAQKATVWLNNGDAYDDVNVVDVDKRKDLAVLKIKAVGLTALRLGRSDAVQPGDSLLVVGDRTSGSNRAAASEELFRGTRQETGYRLFELSNANGHASAGSPVLNPRGDVVAIIEAKVDPGEGVDLAIPADYAAGMLVSPNAPRSLESMNTGGDSNSPDLLSSPPEPAPSRGQPSQALQSDPIGYLQHKIRVWDRDAAAQQLGQPGRGQDAVDIQTEDVIGNTFKYKNPLPQFAEIDLTFDEDSKLLSVAYLYPQGVLSASALTTKMGPHFVKFINPNGKASYVYQGGQHTVSVQTDSHENVVDIMIW